MVVCVFVVGVVSAQVLVLWRTCLCDYGVCVLSTTFLFRVLLTSLSLSCSAACAFQSCTPAYKHLSLDQVMSQNRVAFDMVAEHRSATPRVETLVSLQGQAQDRASSSSGSSGRIVNRSRFRINSAVIETRNGRRDTAVEGGNERVSQWRNGHAEQHEHSSPECVTKANRFQATSNHED